MRIDAAARTWQGARARNDDRYCCDVARGLFAVIDGLGGHPAGDVAADIARATLETCGGEDLLEVFRRINNAIAVAATEGIARSGMGCVATAVRIAGGRVEGAHVGDSRAVLLCADASPVTLTDEHTVGADRRAAGLTTLSSDDRCLTRTLGSERGAPDRWVQRFERDLPPGAILVLATDGLFAGDGEPALAWREGATAAGFADALMDAAQREGLRENVTLVVVMAAEGTDNG